MKSALTFIALLALIPGGMPAGAADTPKASKSAGSPYLLVWAGDERRERSDFMAVLDVRPASPHYGQVVTTLPVHATATMPHHTEYEFPSSGNLFASGWAAGHTFVIDASHAATPKLKSDFVEVSGYGFPHSFVRLANGHVLATFQSHSRGYAPPGGLVELDEAGTPIRSASAETPSLEPAKTWPYSVAVAPGLDRVVVTLTPMGMPEWARPPQGSWAKERVDAIVTQHVQIWRLSDLNLLHTLELPSPPGGGEQNQYPAEPRLLPDGTVYVNTFRCGLYRIIDLAGPHPKAEFVRVFPGGGDQDMCAVPVVVGKYWIQTVGALPGLIALDISDPAKPVEVSRLQLDHRFHMPHWLAADRAGNRLVLTGDTQSWVLLIDFDPQTGKMSVDDSFKQAGAKDPGVILDSKNWPHGGSGAAIVHGALFAPR